MNRSGARLGARGASRGKAPAASPRGEEPKASWVAPSAIDALGRPPGQKALGLALPALTFWTFLDKILPG